MEKFSTKKSLGQNFLQDKVIIQRIVNVSNVDDCNVLEIGPGQGALTTELLKKNNKVLSIEIDQRLVDYLNNKYCECNNFKLINKDFLNTKKEDFSFILDRKIKMVANLPYYITTPIILKTLFDYDFVSEMHVMVQHEVALRFCSEYKKKSYGSITVFLQSIAEVKYEFKVEKEVFKPIPKVDSAIVSLKRKEVVNGFDFNIYEEFLRSCFKQKRKLLSNNLSKAYEIKKDDVINFLLDNGYGENIRPEEIEVDGYLKLYNNFIDKFKI